MRFKRHFFIKCLFLYTIAFATIPQLTGQVDVQVTILDGEATTTCRDGLLAGDPVWGIIIENESEVLYAEEDCPNFIDLPNVQYQTTVNCPSDLNGGQIQLCFRAFDKEAGIFNSCDASDRACEEVVCNTFLLPAPGQDSIYTYGLPDGLSSGGFVNFSITVSDNGMIATNDRICNAINLGSLAAQDILGDASKGLFNNYCASNAFEPSPHQVDIAWQNNVATWFSFTTSNAPNAIYLAEATSDPEQVGDAVNLQLALYKSNDGTCNGNLEFIRHAFNGDDFDEHLILDCLEPNQRYYLMVDGENATVASTFGIYGLQIRKLSLQDAFGDDICDAVPLEVTSNNVVHANFYNNCARNTNDPVVTNFSTNNSIWFEFRPSQTRGVEILVESVDAYPVGTDPIDPKLAIFYAPSNRCTGSLVEVVSQYNRTDGFSESLTLDCLNPKLRYWLLVDGASDPTGIFNISIKAKDYPIPIQIDTTICEGDVLVLGNKTYVNEGIYLDTIIRDNDCAEIIETHLSIAPAINIHLEMHRISSDAGQADGSERISVSGGTGDYSILWSNGQTGTIATGLVGGENYCVTVSDMAGCERVECFTMEYIVPIATAIINDTVSCSGDNNGNLEFSVNAGQIPYEYTLRGIEDPSIVRNGIINKNDSVYQIPNLPVGSYNIFINNRYTVSNVTGLIVAPEALSIQVLNQQNNGCSSNCTGAIALAVNGGSGSYQFSWNNGISNIANPNNLCTGDYVVTVSDENNCIDSLQLTISEPAPLEVEATQLKAVTCFGQRNGQATLDANRPLDSFLWDNGEITATASNLSAGIHQVTVSDENNCESITSVEIMQPLSALETRIGIQESIICKGDSTGVLIDQSTGGNGAYQYTWSNGQNQRRIEQLAAGTYALTVTDIQGCQNFASITLEDPISIKATLLAKDVNCLEGENSGVLSIEAVEGGIAPYRYSLDGIQFIEQSQFANLSAGTYDVILQDANGCEKNYTEEIAEPFKINVALGEDQTIKLGETLNLNAATKRPVSYEWSTNDTINCLDCASISIQPRRNAFYAVKVTDIETGCVAEDQINIAVLKNRNVFFPNIFSPNGDGENDKLSILGGTDIDKVLSFKIFKRNGAMIYEANNFNIGDASVYWDGRYDGRVLNPDVFVYFAEILFIDGERLLYKGDFTLVR